MHLNILTKEQVELLPLLSRFKRKYYLVGGTAIALHIGHRKSIDFDLFCRNNIQHKNIYKVLESINYKQKLIHKDIDQLHLLVNQVKMTFYQFNFDIETRANFLKEIKMPDLLTLASMKAFALGGRNKWKDYVDLYYVIKNHFTVEQISEKAELVFGSNQFNSKLFKGQLSFFEDIDYAEEVEFMPGFEVSDDEIKEFLIEISTRPF
jgi:hypothetical protein